MRVAGSPLSRRVHLDLGSAASRYVFFDLDGTLTDPYVGISRCIAHAMESLDRPLPPDHDFRPYIGPPLRGTFQELCGSEVLAQQALALYRKRFEAVGAYENALYDGVTAMLDRLSDRCLFVCTSKPTRYARRILDYFGIAGRFRGVYGSEMDGTRTDKADLVAWVLHRERLHPRACAMVGDREYDVRGAAANGVRAHGVLWGYGTREELESAGADELHEKPEGVAAQLRSC